MVTGATGGIGRAIALELASRGIRPVLAGRDPKKLDRVRGEVRDRQARVVAFDLTDADQVEAAAVAAGPVDILIHAAGAYASVPPAAAAADVIAHQYAVHVSGPAQLTTCLLPSLRARRGQVVFIGSSVVERVTAGLEVYAAAKFAQRAYADNLRQDVNADGVRVLVVHPGRTATSMQEAIHHAEGRRYDASRLVQPSDIARLVADVLQLPRTVEVTDVHLRPAVPPTRRSGVVRTG